MRERGGRLRPWYAHHPHPLVGGQLMTIDIRLRDEALEEAFTEAKLLYMVVNGETELTNTEFVSGLLDAFTALYDEEERLIKRARTFTTGPDAREDEE